MQTYIPINTSKLVAPHKDKNPPWKIALIANLIDEFERQPNDPLDAGAEFDRQQTIEAIAAALEEDGHIVHFIQANSALPEA